MTRDMVDQPTDSFDVTDDLWRSPGWRRLLQLALAALWMLDGLLQLQPFFFTAGKNGFSGMLAGGAVGMSRRKDGRAMRFAPVGGRDVHTALLMRQTLESAGDPMPALVQFARTLSPDEAGALRNALDDTQASEGGAAEPGS